MKKAVALGLCTTLALAAASSRANDRAVCLDAVSQGQTLRDAHRLVEARDQFRTCGRQQCPHAVQGDCATWLAEIEKILPTVVLSAKDGAGHDVLDATVSADGKIVATKLDGEAVAIDPGIHSFRFERPDGTTTTEQVLIKEGEKARSVAVVLGSAPAPAKAAPPAPPPLPEPARHATEPPRDTYAGAPAKPGGTMRLLGWIVGGVGVVGMGVGAGLAFDAKAKDNTASSEPGLARQTDSQSAVQQGNLATIVLGVGAAAAAAGVVLWVLAPSGSTTVGTNGRQILLQGIF